MYVLPGVLAGAGVPPESATCIRRRVFHSAKRMTPALLHVPLTFVPSTEQMTPAEPSTSDLRFSLPAAKNATVRLSGDQSGDAPPAVSARRIGVSASIDLIQMFDCPSVVATNATFRPSGAAAKYGFVSLKWGIEPPPTASRSKRIICGTGGRRQASPSTNA